MKVVAFNGSPRKDGNTSTLIETLFGELNKAGIESELIQLSEKKLHGCIACYKCFENRDRRCAVTNDAANEYIEMMENAQGIVLGSPVYYCDVTPEMKALIDRTGFVSRANPGIYGNRIGAALVAVRRAGAVRSLDTMNHFLLGSEIIIAGQCVGVGFDKGDVKKDKEGIQTAQALGKRMAWLMEKMNE